MIKVVCFISSWISIFEDTIFAQFSLFVLLNSEKFPEEDLEKSSFILLILSDISVFEISLTLKVVAKHAGESNSIFIFIIHFFMSFYSYQQCNKRGIPSSRISYLIMQRAQDLPRVCEVFLNKVLRKDFVAGRNTPREI